jgi:spore germination cell wall hydrolase CwlJ-like protein
MKTNRLIPLTALVLIAGLMLPKRAEAPTMDNYSLESRIEIVKPEIIPSLKVSPLNYITNDFYKDSDDILLARMLLGEAQGCSPIEKICVAYTAINRMNDGKNWNGTTLQEVILKPYQYSAFNSDRNSKLKNPLAYDSKEFLRCLKLSKEILAGKSIDFTGGATHYLNPNHPDLKGKPLPEWANRLEKIGRIQNSYHVFFKDS